MPLQRPDTMKIAMKRLEHFGIVDSAQQEVSMLPQGVRKILDIAIAAPARAKRSRRVKYHPAQSASLSTTKPAAMLQNQKTTNLL
jgi:hypothetical protein